MFADDAVLDLGMRLEGKKAIRESMQKRSNEIRTRHVLTNIFIEVQDSQHARGISYLTLYRHVGTESLRSRDADSVDACRRRSVTTTTRSSD